MSYVVNIGVLMRLEIEIRKETDPLLLLALMNQKYYLEEIVLRPDTKVSF